MSSQTNQQNSDTCDNKSENSANSSGENVEEHSKDNEPDGEKSEGDKSAEAVTDLGAEDQMETEESKPDERTSVEPSNDSEEIGSETVPLGTQDATVTSSSPEKAEKPLLEQFHQSPEGGKAEPQTLSHQSPEGVKTEPQAIQSHQSPEGGKAEPKASQSHQSPEGGKAEPKASQSHQSPEGGKAEPQAMQSHQSPEVDKAEPQAMQSHQSPEGGKTESQAKFKTPSPPPATSSQSTPLSSQARRMKLLQESLSKLKGMKPKLSGTPHNTIDLDEGTEPSPEEKGMAKLMMRFVKHTRHVTPKQKKEVQVK